MTTSKWTSLDVRQAGYFYERRDKEWRTRSSQLKNVGISRGPSIKELIAQLACYLWKEPKLGPALAKGNLGELLQGEGYDVIRERNAAGTRLPVNLVLTRRPCARIGHTLSEVVTQHQCGEISDRRADRREVADNVAAESCPDGLHAKGVTPTFDCKLRIEIGEERNCRHVRFNLCSASSKRFPEQLARRL
jgi:hypothetical protein